MGVRRLTVLVAVVALGIAGCGGDDDDSATPTEPAGDVADGDGTPDDGPTGDDGAPTGAGGGTLTLGDETIDFDRSRCFLEEQDAAAGGGKILFVGQAFGTNAEGDEVSIDVSRYDEDSDFAGDDVSVVVGSPGSDDAVSYSSRSPIGTVSLDGSVLSAEGLTFSDDDGTEVSGSFEVRC
jgi:hypothetical protein